MSTMDFRLTCSTARSKIAVNECPPQYLMRLVVMLERQTVIPVKHDIVGLTRCGASGMDVIMCGR